MVTSDRSTGAPRAMGVRASWFRLPGRDTRVRLAALFVSRSTGRPPARGTFAHGGICVVPFSGRVYREASAVYRVIHTPRRQDDRRTIGRAGRRGDGGPRAGRGRGAERRA